MSQPSGNAAARHEAGLEISGRLREMGVPLLACSDAGWRATAFETFWKELEELTRTGMNPVVAIAAATGKVARVLDRDERIGTLLPGRQADLLAVDGNVAEDIRCLGQVRAVFQAGQQIVPAASLVLEHA